MKTEDHLEEQINAMVMMNRCKYNIVYSQQNLQPLQQSYQPGQQLNIVFSPSNNFIDLGKVKLYYRIVTQFNQDGFSSLTQKAMVGITPSSRTAPFCIQSVTLSGNQVLSQSQTQLQRTRNIFQDYYNMMLPGPYEKDRLHGEDDGNSSVAFGSSTGNQSILQGLQEVTRTHAVTFNNQGAGNNAGIGNRLENSAFPRAMVDRFKILNNDFCTGILGSNTIPTNCYMMPQLTVNCDPNPAVALTGVFVDLPNSITPSVAVYLRSRFLTQMVTPYTNLNEVSNAWGAVVSPNLDIWGGTGTAPSFNFTGVQKLSIAGSVQQYDLSKGDISRQTGQLWTSTNAQYKPTELYTNVAVSLGELSMELDQIGLISLANTSVVVQLQMNLAANVLSASVQPSLFTANITQGGGSSGSGFLKGATNAQVQTFLDSMLLGSATYFVTDTCVRVPYQVYPSESFAYVKQIVDRPRAYMSTRMQFDPIPLAGSGVFTQRIAISNPIVLGAMCFIVPYNSNLPSYANASGKYVTPSGSDDAGVAYTATSLLPQDSLINYFGCSGIPNAGDVRFNVDDSYYWQFQSLYLQADSTRYSTTDVPISNPALSSYLQSQDGLFTCFGKHINVDFQEYLANRFFAFIPMNAGADPSLAIQDSQVILTVNLDATARIANSQAFNEVNTNLANKFGLLTFLITQQSIVNCSQIRI